MLVPDLSKSGCPIPTPLLSPSLNAHFLGDLIQAHGFQMTPVQYNLISWFFIICLLPKESKLYRQGFFCLKSGLLRYNLHTVNVTLFSVHFCKFLTNTYSCETVSAINYRTVPIPPKSSPYPCGHPLPHVPPWAATNLFFCPFSLVVPFLKSHINGIVLRVTFGIGFFHLSQCTAHLRFTHIVAAVSR